LVVVGWLVGLGMVICLGMLMLGVGMIMCLSVKIPMKYICSFLHNGYTILN